MNSEQIEERVKRNLAADWFAEQMKVKLRENEHKGGWEKFNTWRLLDLLKEEVRELEEAMMQGDEEEIIRECADVGNFAMFIAHKSELERRIY